jgi:UDP-glucose 4-epimerase
MVLPNFARQALSGEPITVYGSGEQSRCFGHVRDAVEALLRLVDTPAALNEVFNVGSTEETSIRELAELVRTEAGSDSSVVVVPYEEAYAAGFEDMLRRVPDVSKLERTTGFRPMTTLRQIVADVVEDQRGRLAAAGSRRPSAAAS